MLIYLFIYIYLCIYIYICMIYIYIYIYICIQCIWVYIYIYIYIHILCHLSRARSTSGSRASYLRSSAALLMYVLATLAPVLCVVSTIHLPPEALTIYVYTHEILVIIVIIPFQSANVDLRAYTYAAPRAEFRDSRHVATVCY